MTKIEWTQNADGSAGKTWNPTLGCSRVSPGCDNCYAAAFAHRGLDPHHRGLTVMTDDGVDWTGAIKLLPERLDVPFSWRKPMTVFVDSMSDLFDPDVPDEFLDQVFAVMSLTPRHTYQILTKRPQRMNGYVSDPATPGRVAKAADRIAVRREVQAMGEEQFRPVARYPGYLVSDRGRVVLEGGSDVCIWCAAPIPEERIARARFCTQTCNSKAHYEQSQGRWSPPDTVREMRPDADTEGRQRVRLVGEDGEQHKEFVYRLVLEAFVRVPVDGEQGCHRDGDPSNNALPNLRWGTTSENWDDRIRHGLRQSYTKLTWSQVDEVRRRSDAGESQVALGRAFGVSDTQIRNIVNLRQWEPAAGWPLKSVHLGTSIELDRYRFRADHLRRTPAALRFLSLEPLLGPLPELDLTGIGWVLVGGESGPKARPLDVAWVTQIVDACRAAGVPVFVKQLGSVWAKENHGHSKGNTMGEWPAELQLQEWPA